MKDNILAIRIVNQREKIDCIFCIFFEMITSLQIYYQITKLFDNTPMLLDLHFYYLNTFGTNLALAVV